jgi:hypothetical protein
MTVSSSQTETSYSEFSYSTLWLEEQLDLRITALPNNTAVSDELKQLAIDTMYELGARKNTTYIRFAIVELAYLYILRAVQKTLSQADMNNWQFYLDQVKKAEDMVDTDGDDIVDTPIAQSVSLDIKPYL